MNSLNYFNIYGHDVRFPNQMEQILCVIIFNAISKPNNPLSEKSKTENLLRLKHYDKQHCL